ncbi:hypothetical protein [Nocardia sp. CY41]|uniref:hypothetical protein n=1 Tax=Nocardia sp. CY41 TaxID=2608686 RepID=UPI001359ED55|nr:hypothetical protein [Nocardia sp. CY41]
MSNHDHCTAAETAEDQRRIEFARWCRDRAETDPWTEEEKDRLRNGDDIARLRKALARELDFIDQRCRRAQDIIGELRSPAVYDVEFEGGSDTETRVADARRAIAEAIKVNPGREADETEQHHAAQQRLSTIAAHITPCPRPIDEATVCEHNEPWPCAMTRIAWTARGWDIDEGTWRAAPENLPPF